MAPTWTNQWEQILAELNQERARQGASIAATKLSLQEAQQRLKSIQEQLAQEEIRQWQLSEQYKLQQLFVSLIGILILFNEREARFISDLAPVRRDSDG